MSRVTLRSDQPALLGRHHRKKKVHGGLIDAENCFFSLSDTIWRMLVTQYLAEQGRISTGADSWQT